MAAPDTIRAFISLEFPGTVKEAVDQLQERLKASGGDANWVKPTGLHLTLKFLGQVPVGMIPAIREALDPVVTQGHRLKVQVGGVGAFPHMKNPRIIWLDLQGDERLMRLQNDVEEAMSRLGFVPERRAFQPHLTIGRVRSRRGRQVLIRALEAEKAWEVGDCELSELCLMKSELRSEGAVYTPLWSKAFPG